jgi:hypothetical protein
VARARVEAILRPSGEQSRRPLTLDESVAGCETREFPRLPFPGQNSATIRKTLAFGLFDGMVPPVLGNIALRWE